MSIFAPPSLQTVAALSASERRGTLALSLQEPLTAGARLRAHRQVAADAEAFRIQIKQLIARADQEARQAGYDPADVKLSVYGYVAFLDESVLNSGLPMFGGWARQPLQEELFGDHRGGELFFLHLDELLGRPDSEDLADVLEVFQLCMLLGFRGRYSAADDGGLRTRVYAVRQKIERIRGHHGPLSPAALLPPDDVLPKTHDPWLRPLLYSVGMMLLITVVLYLVYRVSLGGQVAELRELATGLVP